MYGQLEMVDIIRQAFLVIASLLRRLLQASELAISHVGNEDYPLSFEHKDEALYKSYTVKGRRQKQHFMVPSGVVS